MKDFKTWIKEPEAMEVLKEVPIHLVERIWSAAKISALDNFTDLIRRKVLIVNPANRPSSIEPEE